MVATALQYAIQAAIQNTLGDLVNLQALSVTPDDSSLTVVVQYILRQTNTPQTLEITRTMTTP